MESLLESIRIAITDEANDETRAAGAAACRTILSALEAKAGEPLAAPSPPLSDASNIASAVAALRDVPPDQLLDLAIARLRAALPPDVAPASVRPMKFQLVQLPRVLPTKSKR